MSAVLASARRYALMTGRLCQRAAAASTTASAAASPTASAAASVTASTVACPALWLRRLSLSAASRGRVVPFLLSDIGEGIVEVVVKEWYVSEGDTVAQFDSLCEVQSDKASVTITSRYDGVVRRLHCQVDGVARVGLPLVDIETAPDDEVELQERDAIAVVTAATEEPDAVQLPAARQRVLTTPAVRRLAAQHSVQLSRVGGTGRDGRVLKEDLLRYVEQQQNQLIPAAPAVTGESSPSAPAPAATVMEAADKVVPITGFTRAMFAAMTQSLTVPHFGYCDEYDVTALVQLRNRLVATGEAGSRLSYMPFILKACSLALLQYPSLNAWLTADSSDRVLTHKASHNLGVAMDTPSGLVVPAVRAVQTLRLVQIGVELRRLQDLGAAGQLTPADMADVTLTVSNVGSVGGTYASPVIVPPQVAIGAVGRIQRLPRFSSLDSADVVAAHIMSVSWSADHRVIDGATMARFSNVIKGFLERPETMLLAMG